MAYIVLLKKSAEKELENLPVKIQDRILKRLIVLKNNPHPYLVKKLHGSSAYRIKVGDYRILYTINNAEKKIEVFSIAHRKEAYR